MQNHAVSMVSLGCAKNLVDSEGVLGALVERGWLVAGHPEDADLILINTCGFIGDAREESAAAIEEALACKKAGLVRGVVVFGCMVQLLREKLGREFPGVDAWVGVAEPGAVVEACEKAVSKNKPAAMWLPDPAARRIDFGPRLRVTPKHYAYLRISEGCDNRCRYCLIPSIRGPLRSKPAEQVLKEAGDLVADGARELIVIAQDTTNYGKDIFGEARLAPLLRRLRELDGLEWLRLLYTHPAHFSDDLLAAFGENGRLLPYVDLPIQHANDGILERMGRQIGSDGLRDLMGRIREAAPAAVIRTSIIVGLPGEGDDEFEELLDFMREVRFERLGVFTYSPEAGTLAAEMDGQVPEEVKEERRAKVMEFQHRIAVEQGEELVGREIGVVVDGRGPDGEWTGRTVRDAPDVDGSIRFEQTGLEPGTFGTALVTDAYGYDLTGRMLARPEIEQD